MTLPVFFPAPEVAATLPPGERLSVRELCSRAGVDCRVTGPPADRVVRIGDSPELRAVCAPGPSFEVWLGMPPGPPRNRAVKALGFLAYGVFDYAARESLRGLPMSKPSPGRGRPPTGSRLSPAERQRRYRQRLARRNSR